ncbi:MAG: CotH kinase family protein, partial [Thiotrichales bacterium]
NLSVGQVSLAGTATDDGKPTSSSLAVTWSALSGPGPVGFGNASALATTAGFSVAGEYWLRLTANDGEHVTSDDLKVTVIQDATPVKRIVLSEIFYNPPASLGNAYEFLEFYNAESTAVDLSGYALTQGVAFTFPSGASVAPGAYFIVAADGSKYQAPGRTVFQWSSGQLDNGGETITLADAEGRIVASVTYDDAAPWPTAPDGNGPSLELINLAGDNADAGNWRASANNGGSPGAASGAGGGYEPPPPAVVINEILASNATVLADPDDGVYGDWIELHNTSNLPVNVGGFYLSDDPAGNPAKWRIPDGTTIAPLGFLLIWADDGDKLGQALHTNFKLSQSGEAVSLADTTGRIIDSRVFGQQTTDISYGRSPDGGDTWLLFTNPTPGATNNSSSGSTQLAPPAFSKPAGFYSGNQTVTISTNEPGAQIGYTLDGSEPASANSGSSIQVTLSSTKVLRARVFKTGRTPSRTETNTYFINFSTTLPVFSVSTDPKNLYDAAIGILHPNNINQDWEREVHVEFFETDKQRKIATGGGIELDGQSTRNQPVKTFALRARSEYGSSTFKHKFFPDRKNDEFTSLVLRSSGNDMGVTFMRDALAHSLLVGQLDVDRLAYRPGVMFLNGEYLGLRNIREKKNKFYVADNHGVDPNQIDMLESYDNGVIEGDANHYNALKNYVYGNDIRLPAVYAQVASQMEIDEYISYYLTQIYVANFDWPVKNIRYWRPRVSGGKWRWILYDLDMGFNIWNGSPPSSDVFAYLLNESGQSWELQAKRLFQNLMRNASFEAELMQRLAGLLNTSFESNRVIGIINGMSDVIRPEMPAHIARWNGQTGPYGMSYWDDQLQILRNFASQRPGYLRSQMLSRLGSKTTGFAQLTVENPSPASGQVLVSGAQIPAQVSFSGQWFKNLPLKLKAVPAPGKQFVRWEGAVSGATPEVTLTMTENRSIRAIFE